MRAGSDFGVVLFLEFEGVLHAPGDASLVPDGGRYAVAGQPMRWARHLADILREFPGVGIIVHGAWRHRLTNAGLKTLFPDALRGRFLGATNRRQRERYGAIRGWCSLHEPAAHVILDACSGEFPAGLRALVSCDPQAGLSSPSACAALRAALAAATGQSARLRREGAGAGPSPAICFASSGALA